ncbi:MAG TPA: hypothetical protein VJV78_29950 [Polyangiales bacterium]|nr:hypothetical protein [Polyangiales bacterium]
MNRDDIRDGARSRGLLRVTATIATVLLLPPFIALAVLPMLLLLAPVALICIPFIVPAMLSGSLAARSEDIQRASWRPAAHSAPAPRAGLRVVH